MPRRVLGTAPSHAEWGLLGGRSGTPGIAESFCPTKIQAHPKLYFPTENFVYMGRASNFKTQFLDPSIQPINKRVVASKLRNVGAL